MSDKNQESSPAWEVHEPDTAPTTTAVEAITRAEVDIQIATANKYPRNIAKVKANLIAFATLDEETAESCFYRIPRGGKNIEGPSVRMAEIAVSEYRNIRAATRIVSIVATGDNPHVLVQGICQDMEKNTTITVEKRRRIIGKKSNKGKPDEDDINLAANNASAIAFRDSVFKVIPGALIKPALDAAMRVARGEAKPMADRVAICLATYLKMGVSKEQVLAKFGYTSTEQLTGDDLDTLSGLRTAIKEGECQLHNEFPPISGAAGPSAKANPAGAPRPPRGRETSPLNTGDEAKATTGTTTPASGTDEAPFPEDTEAK